MVCYASVGVGHLPAAHLKRWACWRKGESQTKRSAEAVCEGERKAGVQSAALMSLAASAPGTGSAFGNASEWRCKQGKGCTCARRPAEAGEVCEQFRASAQAGRPSCGGQRKGGGLRAGQAAAELKGRCVSCRKPRRYAKSEASQRFTRARKSRRSCSRPNPSVERTAKWRLGWLVLQA